MPSIGIDLQGGDHAPEALIAGLELALAELSPQTQLHLCAEPRVLESLAPDSRYVLHACTSPIAMDEHPVRAVQQKSNSSLVSGFRLLAKGQIEAWASSGHSGAMMAAALQYIGTEAGVTRPAVLSFLPRLNQAPCLLLDVGINVDCKAEQLLEFARLGSEYWRKKQPHTQRLPRVALLNTGQEASKGSLLYQKAHALLAAQAEKEGFAFWGNLEARSLYDNTVDIVVCDGFSGNLLLKQAEAFYRLHRQLGLEHEFYEAFNYERYGALPMLGLKKPVLLAHGASGPLAIKNMILATESVGKG